ETLGLEGRLLYPMLRDASGAMHRVSWDEALARTADGFRNIIRQHGPDSAAFYLSGQLLTEDYYAANKLMKGFIGSGNVDTNSRLCMASSVAGHRRAFGSDTVPGNYEDLDEADLIVLVGWNAAWCHPMLFQRIVKNSERGEKVVVIDPRRTATAEEADLFLPIAPGMDTALFSGLLVYLADHRALDRAFIESHTDGFDAALARARNRAGHRGGFPRGETGGRGYRKILRAVLGEGKERHLLLARSEPVGARHRQGERDHQLSSRDRPDRKAGGGAV